MNQRTHTWIALRAVALLDDEGDCPQLAKLLKPRVREAAIGSWIPDLRDAKDGGAATENHILKMKPYTGSQQARFVMDKSTLRGKLGSERAVHDFLGSDTTLSASWWSKAYKAKPVPGKHLANRASALAVSLTDMLIFGDPDVAKRVPGTVGFAKTMHPNTRSREEEVAMHAFMLSHFMADCNMPCHCDARKLSSYSNGLHKELEAHWSKQVGTYFDKKKLALSTDSAAKVLQKAREVDDLFSIEFTGIVPELKERDVWLEAINVCRASFAVASIIAPPSQYPYTSTKKAPFETVFADQAGADLLEWVDWVSMHDAVLNTAMVWKYVWKKFD